ncbi:MAG: dihydroxy-acid dehydratase [Gammaproteobacteria bacterium]
MLGRNSQQELNAYGPWPWLAGYVLAAVLAGVMFGLATGFL